MPLSDRKAGATNYPLNKILKIRFALVVCFISIFSLNNSDDLKGRAKNFFKGQLIHGKKERAEKKIAKNKISKNQNI